MQISWNMVNGPESNN